MRRAGFELTNPDIVDAVHIREVFDTLLDAREGFLSLSLTTRFMSASVRTL
jgi:hypothetical protein